LNVASTSDFILCKHICPFLFFFIPSTGMILLQQSGTHVLRTEAQTY
jgi:hypothetical protein